MNLLVCGSRNQPYTYEYISAHIFREYGEYIKTKDLVILEGCCQNSPDKHAERLAEEWHIPIKHYPAQPKGYLKRNLAMLRECDEVIAFWDLYSYGTMFVIAHATRLGKPVKIIKL